MFKPSKEQRKINKTLQEGHNINIQAVPGSGKTTTVIYLIVKNPNLRFLCLTFSRRLYEESKEKVEQFTDCRNYDFYTIDGSSYRFFKGTKFDYITEEHKPVHLNYDVIVIDECQDIGINRYKYLKLLISKNKKCQIITCGDVKQTIFGFVPSIRSDNRVLTYSEKIFNNGNEWKYLTLSESFRIPKNITSFLNDVILGYNGEYIRSNKEIEHKPRYIITDNLPERIIQEINYYLDQGYTYEDIFVLSPTIHKCSQIAECINNLSYSDIPIYVQQKDEQANLKIMKNKLCFLTFHTCKGLERKVIIVTHFAETYYSIMKTEPSNECPNPLYVALTRCLERLSVIHKEKERRFPFIDQTKIPDHCELINYKEWKTCLYCPPMRRTYYSVTELLDYIGENSFASICANFKIKNITEGRKALDIPVIIKIDNLFENIANISGIASALFVELKSKGTCSIENHLAKHLKSDTCIFDKELKEELGLLLEDYSSIDKILRLCTFFEAYSMGKIYRLNQIKRYDWIDEDDKEKLIEDIDIDNFKGEFEKKASKMVKYNGFSYEITGIADYIDERKIVEFKCKREIEFKDYVQVMVYYYLFGGNRKCYLINTLTDQKDKISTSADMEVIIGELIGLHEYEYNITDEEFFSRCGLGN